MQTTKYSDCRILSGREQNKSELQASINEALSKGYELIDFAAVPNNATGYHGTCLYTAIMAKPIMIDENADSPTSNDITEESAELEVYSINCSDKQSVAFTEPVSFKLKDKTVEVGAWNQLVVRLCEIIQAKNIDRFDKVLSHFGPRRIAHDFPPEVPATNIKGTDLFINTVFSAEHAKSTALQLITLFGYDRNELIISLRDRPKKT